VPYLYPPKFGLYLTISIPVAAFAILMDNA
jgi:hypothetical protein